MKVFITFHIDNGSHGQTESEQQRRANYIDMINMMFSSVDLVYAESRKVLITDTDSCLDGVDPEIEVMRMNLNPAELMLSRLKAQIEFIKLCSDTELVFLDSDMLILGDVDEIFRKPFDVAFTHTKIRPETKCLINGGVFFVKNKRKDRVLSFFSAVLKSYITNYGDCCNWWGDQYAIEETIGRESIYGYLPFTILERVTADVLLLNYNHYNYFPKREIRSVATPFKAKRRLIHFKGGRKALMKVYWDTYIALKKAAHASPYAHIPTYIRAKWNRWIFRQLLAVEAESDVLNSMKYKILLVLMSKTLTDELAWKLEV